MAKNKIIDISDKTDCILKDCKTYLEEDGWYASLLYEYKDTDNIKHRVKFPKVELPFNQVTMPSIVTDPIDKLFYAADIPTVMITRKESKIYPASGEMIDFEKGTVKFINAMWCDVVEAPAEMTIEDIEKALGHKVKIVSKEK